MFRKYSIIFIVILIIAAVTFVAAFFLVQNLQKKSLEDKIYADIGSQVSFLSRASKPMLLDGDHSNFQSKAPEELLDLLRSASFLPGIGCLEVRYPNQTVSIPSSMLCDNFRQRGEELELPNFFGDETHLSIVADPNAVQAELANSQVMSAFFAAGIALLLMVFGFGLYGYFRRSEAKMVRKEVYESPLGVIKLKPDLRIEEANPAVLSFCANPDVNLTGAHISELFTKSTVHILEKIIENMTGKTVGEEIIDEVKINNPTKDVYCQAAVRPGVARPKDEFFITLTDVTPLVADRERVKHLLRTDTLTGALSRFALQEDFSALPRDAHYLLLLLDVDYFKSANDFYGHAAGDEVLIKIVHNIQAAIHGQAHLVRLGGEEFVVLRKLSDGQLNDQVALFDWIETIRQISGASFIKLESGEISRTMSAGAVILNTNMPLSNALSRADLALSIAKSTGRNKTQAFLDLKDAAKDHLEDAINIDEVKRALSSGSISLFLQPLCDVANEDIYGYETLVRWEKDGQLIPPNLFLNEYYKVLNSLSLTEPRYKIFSQVLKGLKDGYARTVSFNIRADDILDGQYQKLISELSSETENFTIVLEISESIFSDRIDMSDLNRVLVELREHGFLIALDDFGVEGSNLQRLLDLPVDVLKLDKYFVGGDTFNDASLELLKAIKALCDNMNIKLIIEGIETPEQSYKFKNIGINVQQGYHFSKPVRSDKLAHVTYDELVLASTAHQSSEVRGTTPNPI